MKLSTIVALIAGLVIQLTEANEDLSFKAYRIDGLTYRLIQTRTLAKDIASGKGPVDLSLAFKELGCVVPEGGTILYDITTATLLAFMPELGQLSGNEAAARVGVAPHNDDSAKSNKKRHIHGGRSRVRKVLYMSATSAIRYNPILKALYAHLISKGKIHKVAIVAVMRKLIVLLNRLLKDENFKLA